jgi:hypothetical protein
VTAAHRARRECRTVLRTPHSLSPYWRSRRCSIGSAVIGTPYILTPESPLLLAFPSRSCTACVHMEWPVRPSLMRYSEAAAVGRFDARFAGVAFPREMLLAKAWRADRQLVGTVVAPGRDNIAVLTDVRLTLA